MPTPTTPAATLRALADAEQYLSVQHGALGRHDVMGADYTCAGCQLRDRLAVARQLLDTTTEEQPEAVPDTGVRDRLAAVLDECRTLIPTAQADAVLAVLPVPADRAATLRKAASAVESSDVPYDMEAATAALTNGGPFALIAYIQLAIGAHLRRLADEAQQPEVRCTCFVINDGGVHAGRCATRAAGQEPVQLRWGLDDVMVGDDGTTTIMLSGPGGAPYWLELGPERTAALRDNLGGPEAEAQQSTVAEVDDTLHACPGRWAGPKCRCFDAVEPTGPAVTEEPTP